jgi:hypothetical protein
VYPAPKFRTTVSAGFALVRWQLPPGSASLDGQTLSVEGLESTLTDVLVMFIRANGRHIQFMLEPEHPSAVLNERDTTASVAAYLRVGIEHILMGFDHLSFALALVLLVKDDDV